MGLKVTLASPVQSRDGTPASPRYLPAQERVAAAGILWLAGLGQMKFCAQSIDYADLPLHPVNSVVQVSMSGMGFAAEKWCRECSGWGRRMADEIDAATTSFEADDSDEWERSWPRMGRRYGSVAPLRTPLTR